MQQVAFLYSLVTTIAAITFLGAIYAPSIASAQANICIFSNDSCDSQTRIGQPCPCLVANATPPVIPGICIAIHDCQATPAGIAESISAIAGNPLTSLSLAGGQQLVSLLTQSSQSSAGQSDTGSMLTTAWNPSLTNTYDTTAFDVPRSAGFEHLDSLINSLSGPQNSSLGLAAHYSVSTPPIVQVLESPSIR